MTLKRVTFRELGPIQFECYFCFKPEASEMQLSELDVRSIGVMFDLQHGEGGREPGDAAHPLPERAGRRRACASGSSSTAASRSTRSAAAARRSRTTTRARGLGRRAGRRADPLLQRGSDQDQLALPARSASTWGRCATPICAATIACFDVRADAADDGCRRWPTCGACSTSVLFVETDTDKRAFFYVDSVLMSGEF